MRVQSISPDSSFILPRAAPGCPRPTVREPAQSLRLCVQQKLIPSQAVLVSVCNSRNFGGRRGDGLGLIISNGDIHACVCFDDFARAPRDRPGSRAAKGLEIIESQSLHLRSVRGRQQGARLGQFRGEPLVHRQSRKMRQLIVVRRSRAAMGHSNGVGMAAPRAGRARSPRDAEEARRRVEFRGRRGLNETSPATDQQLLEMIN